MAGGGEAVGVDDAADLGIIISALQVIESRLLGVSEAKTQKNY